MRVSTLSRISLAVVVITLMGQSCSIPGFSSGTPKGDGGVFRSDNHGQTWKQKSAGPNSVPRGLKEASVRVLAFDPRNPDRLEVGTASDGLWFTTNGGDVWQPSSVRTGQVPCLAMKNSDPDVQYIAYGSTVQKSLNNGLTWRTVYTDGQGQGVTCVVADRNESGVVYATTSAGKLLKSADDGKTWTIILTTRAFIPRRIIQDDQYPGHLTVFTRTTGILDIDLTQQSWQNINGSMQKYPGAIIINGVDALFGNPSVWTLATNYGLLQSFDRGTTWTVLPTLVTPGSSPIQNVAVNPRDPKEMIITIGTKVHQTRDGGATWTIMSIPTARIPVTLTFDPTRIDRMYLGTFLVKK